LGTCEVTPFYTETVNYKAIDNQIAGALPLDETMEGYSMTIQLMLTAYNELLFQQMRARLSLLNTVGRYNPYQDVGSTVYGIKTVQLILQNSFFGTANASPGDIPGYIFYAAKYCGSTPTAGGTCANKLGLVFNCQSIYLPITPDLSQKRSGTFRCYDTPTIISTLVP
jgi:hypothetical protein